MRWSKELESKGVRPVYPPRDTGFFVSTAINDPDGNYIEFTQMCNEWFKLLEETTTVAPRHRLTLEGKQRIFVAGLRARSRSSFQRKQVPESNPWATPPLQARERLGGLRITAD
jgi:hypothetical protein